MFKEAKEKVQPSHTRSQEHSQQYNEALLKMAILFYQIDGMVTLSEQDYFETLIDTMEWKSGISQTAFISQVIHEARVAIDSGEASEYLRALGPLLNLDAANTLEVAMDITAVDGERSDEELELLSLLSNRILAKHLVA